MLKSLLGLLIGVALAAGVYAYTDADGSPTNRIVTKAQPVEVVEVAQIGTPPNVTTIQITVRSTVQYPLMGEVWYEVLRRGAILSFYQAEIRSFGPLDPHAETTITFTDLDFDQSRPFRIRSWVREALPDYEPRAQNITTENNVMTLRQATYEIQISNPKIVTTDGSPHLVMTMRLTNRDARDHAYRALVDMRPVGDQRNVVFRSGFYAFDAQAAQQSTIQFDEPVALSSETAYIVTLWVQIEGNRGNYHHLVQINLPRTVTIAENRN